VGCPLGAGGRGTSKLGRPRWGQPRGGGPGGLSGGSTTRGRRPWGGGGVGQRGAVAAGGERVAVPPESDPRGPSAPSPPGLLVPVTGALLLLSPRGVLVGCRVGSPPVWLGAAQQRGRRWGSPVPARRPWAAFGVVPRPLPWAGQGRMRKVGPVSLRGLCLGAARGVLLRPLPRGPPATPRPLPAGSLPGAAPIPSKAAHRGEPASPARLPAGRSQGPPPTLPWRPSGANLPLLHLHPLLPPHIPPLRDQKPPPLDCPQDPSPLQGGPGRPGPQKRKSGPDQDLGCAGVGAIG